MQLNISSELELKLGRIAAEQGKDTESLVCEAVERLVSHDEWFIGEVESGLRSADRGEFIEHAQVRALIDSRYPG